MPEPLVVYVDCRFDNSRSGYHGTLPIINAEDDRVIEMVTLTRKQIDSSWKIETTALEEALTSLEQIGLKIQEVVHDDNFQEKRQSPSDSAVEGATTIAAIAVFLVQQLKDFCSDNGLQTTGSKLQLVQRVSLALKLPEAEANIEIQRTRPLRYPELAQHDLAYKLKSWIYTCAKNAAKSVHYQIVINNTGGKTHKAVKDFLKKYIIESKMKFYIKAHENFISETFQSVINKYATNRIHFDRSHTARLACAALDWNENIRRKVRAVYNRGGNNTTVRRRACTNRVLVRRTSAWKS
ncbi:hypothetical protein R1flu_006147 [Riccia fluitans]|uniref:SAP domain-containing protein n=1 Tax=Riccia fluitans TaxID=41844 RepID=A0ABD1YV75_9MARC